MLPIVNTHQGGSVMIKRFVIGAAALLALSGCATYDYVGDGSGYYQGYGGASSSPYGYSPYGSYRYGDYSYYGNGYYPYRPVVVRPIVLPPNHRPGHGHGNRPPQHRPDRPGGSNHDHRPPRPPAGNGGGHRPPPQSRPPQNRPPRPESSTGSPWRNMDQLQRPRRQQQPYRQQEQEP